MPAPSSQDTLVAGLRKLLRVAKLPLAEASRRLDRDGKYLERALRGKYRLKALDVFAVLEMAQVPAWEFFDVYFPFGGEPVRELRKQVEARVLALPSVLKNNPSGVGLEPATAQEWVEAVREHLRETIRTSGVSFRQVSLHLGFQQDSLAQALRGGHRLQVRQWLGALDFLEVPVGAFFLGLMAAHAPVVGKLHWAQVLGKLGRAVERVAALPEPPPLDLALPEPEEPAAEAAPQDAGAPGTGSEPSGR
ncbi:MAG: hypothetical protein U0002_10825 [Thermoanaerobaculia bacterium]